MHPLNQFDCALVILVGPGATRLNLLRTLVSSSSDQEKRRALGTRMCVSQTKDVHYLLRVLIGSQFPRTDFSAFFYFAHFHCRMRGDEENLTVIHLTFLLSRYNYTFASSFTSLTTKHSSFF